MFYDDDEEEEARRGIAGRRVLRWYAERGTRPAGVVSPSNGRGGLPLRDNRLEGISAIGGGRTANYKRPPRKR